MRTLLTAAAVIFLLCTYCTAQPVVNEIMYAPIESTNEWFEITNTGDDADLANWKWKDVTSTLRIITTQSFTLRKDSFVVICQDSSKFKAQFPFHNGRLFQTAWSTLNNTGDNLILVNSSGSRVDSVSFTSTWGGNNNCSLERRNPSGNSNVSQNWGSSVSVSKATPNFENSIRTKEFDLAIRSVSVSPFNPISGEHFEIKIAVHNTGINAAQNSSLKIYDDVNLDSLFQEGELVRTFALPVILSSDSSLTVAGFDGFPAGRRQFIIAVEFQPDQDTIDNKVIMSVNIRQPGNSGSLVINEIMYDPLTGMAEWLELFNASPGDFDLKNWKLKDNTSSYEIADSMMILPQGFYLVIASDSTVFRQFMNLRSTNGISKTVVVHSLSLNNSGESLVLEDSLGTVMERFTYSTELHNPELEVTKGISLERINPALPSAYSTNWSSCADREGGTPGEKNSIYASDASGNSTLNISPNPFSPDGDGYEDHAVISCSFGFSKGTVRASIYDVKGRVVRMLANNEITGAGKTLLFDGYSDGKQRLPIGIYFVIIEAIDQVRGEPVTVKAPVVIADAL